MNVRSQMTAAVVTMAPDATVDEARRCLTASGLRCVPVTQVDASWDWCWTPTPPSHMLRLTRPWPR